MRRQLVFFATAVLIVAACGSDDDEGGSVDTAGATTTSVALTAEETVPATTASDDTDAPPETTEPPTTDGDDENADSGEIPTGDANSDWCVASRDINDRFDALDLVDFSDREMLERTYTEALDALRDAQRLAPPELRDVVAVNIDGFTTLNGALDDVDWSFFDLDLSVIEELDTEMSAVNRTIDEYNFYVCEIDNGFDPDASTDDDADDDLPAEGTIRDATIAEIVSQGFTQQEAECIVDKIDFTSIDPSDNTYMLSVFEECEISLSRLGELFG